MSVARGVHRGGGARTPLESPGGGLPPPRNCPWKQVLNSGISDIQYIFLGVNFNYTFKIGRVNKTPCDQESNFKNNQMVPYKQKCNKSWQTQKVNGFCCCFFRGKKWRKIGLEDFLFVKPPLINESMTTNAISCDLWSPGATFIPILTINKGKS